MRRALPFLLAIAVVAAVVVGLVQAKEKTPDEPRAGFDAEAALKSLEGAPPPLARLHDDASRLLGGGLPAFRRRMRELRGHPVVINKWGSWCGPCRAEFPIFQRAAAKHGKTVAFLGIDGRDNRAQAEKFLAEFPLSFPSYVDFDEEIARAYDAPNNYPITVFVDRRGKVVFPHAGPYRSVAELDRDIKRYLGA